MSISTASSGSHRIGEPTVFSAPLTATQLNMPSATGTGASATINSTSGKLTTAALSIPANTAFDAVTAVVNNSFVTTSSKIFATIVGSTISSYLTGGAPFILQAKPGPGSITFYIGNASDDAVTTQTLDIAFFVMN